MRKSLLAICLAAGLMLAPAGTAMADEQVSVTLPAFPVTLNGVTFEQSQLEYPLLVYKNITYVAMTYHDARLLGLETQWSMEQGLFIKKMEIVPEQLDAQNAYVPYVTDTINAGSYPAVRPSFAITVNGTSIDNSKEEYPLLVFRNVTYFPLTWRFAVDEFGWEYTFDAQNGLTITPVPTPVPTETPDASPAEPAITNGTPVYVTGDVVNLRTGAGTSHTRAGQVQEGDRLTVCGSETDTDGKVWYQVQMEDGAKLWIASWLVSASKAEAENAAGVSTGVRTSAALGETIQDGRKTVFSIKNGEGNVYSIDSVSETGLTLTLDNVDVHGTLTAQKGDFSLQVASAGDGRAAVTIAYSKGSYVDAVQDGDWLRLNCYETGNTLAGRTIVLDPGHGGVDVGGQGITMKHVTDADIGYTVAVKLQKLLEADGATVVFTRGDLARNERVFMTERIEMSNNLEPDIYISIHGNSTEGQTTATGAETYTYNGKIYTQKALADNLAEKICAGLATATGEKSVTKSANFYVLRMNNHPSVLVECAYLSNPHDEALLATDSYRQKLAEGIYAGVVQYFQQF